MELGRDATMHKLIACSLLLAGMLHAQSAPQSLIGKGWGLDHVIVFQASPNGARQTFAEKLGFSIVSGNKFPDQGLENGPVLLPPAYLELMWAYDPEKAASAAKANGAKEEEIRAMQEKGGGILAYNIDVSPIAQAADFMRKAGFQVDLPPSITTIRDGKEQRGPWQFLQISADRNREPAAGIPGGQGVGILEYADNVDRLSTERLTQTRERIEHDAPDPRRKAGDLHANTAKKLESVWVAVANLQEGVKQSELLGLKPLRERTLESIAARGREVQCGQGTIVFWEGAKDRNLPLGPFGVSIGVDDINRAHEIAEKGMGRQLRLEKYDGRTRFLVPPDGAGGIWLEFVQIEAPK
jgi:hypothetical protein